MGIFSTSEHGPCGIFAPGGWCGDTLIQDITFVRAASLLTPTAPVQNTAAEVLLSFVTLGPYTLDVQPQPAGFSRMMAGQLVKVDLLLIGMGTVDLQEGDRCTIDGRRLEVVNALHYGGHHTEIELQHLGR